MIFFEGEMLNVHIGIIGKKIQFHLNSVNRFEIVKESNFINEAWISKLFLIWTQ